MKIPIFVCIVLSWVILEYCSPFILKTSKRDELKYAPMFATLLKEVAVSNFEFCHNVILSSLAENDVIEETKHQFQQIIGVSLSYDWGNLANPPSSSILHFIPSSEKQNQNLIRTNAKTSFCITFFVITRKDFFNQIAQDMAKSNWFPGATRNLVIFCPEMVSHDRMMKLSKDLGMLYHIVIISQNEKNQSQEISMKIIELCHFCYDGEGGPIVKGYWNPLHGLAMKSLDLLHGTLKNFRKRTFTSCALEFPLYMKYTKEDDKIILQDSLDRRMYEALANYYNFTIEVHEPPDGKWGVPNENGTYNGIIGYVQRRKYDFSNSIVLSWARSAALTLTRQYVVDPIIFVAPKPKLVPYWTSIARPFSGKTWVCVIVAILVSAPFFVYLQQRKKKENVSFHNFTQLSIELFGSLLAQHFRWKINIPTMLFMGAFLLFSLFITKLYMSNLVSYLTIPILSPAINSLQELIHSDFSWGVENIGGADTELFKTSADPMYQTIYSKMELCSGVVACLQRVYETHFCFITWKVGVRLVISKYFKDSSGEAMVYLSRDEFYPSGIGFGLQKGSILQQPFDEVIIRLLEAGIVENWTAELIETKGHEKNQSLISKNDTIVDNKQAVQLTMPHLEGIFIIHAVGVVISLCSLQFEILIHRLMASENRMY